MKKLILLLISAFLVSSLLAQTDGEVAYSEGGGLGFDATFFWDDTNHFLGIGTNTPAWPIDVVTNGAGYLFTTSYRDSLSGGGGLQIQHARGTSDSPLPLNDGDPVGAIYFNPLNQDGTFSDTAAEIQGLVRTQSSGVVMGKLNFIVESSYTPAMTISGGVSTGAFINDVVSIGNAKPTQPYKLQVLDEQFHSVPGIAGYFQEAPSFNTSSGPLTGYAGWFVSNGARKFGLNPLTNVGIYATAVNGDNNYAAIFYKGNVGIGTQSPKAVLDVTSTTSGMLPPRMTQAQRDAIASPKEGMMIYNLTTHKLNVFTTVWETVSSGP